MEIRMGIFDSFKNTKSFDITEEQNLEIATCYQSFYAEISEQIRSCRDNTEKATRIGAEILILAHYDFDNFNTLLHNNLGVEINTKETIFLEEQATFYILLSDRYLFSVLGSSGRNIVIEDLEDGYLNNIMNLANSSEATIHSAQQWKQHYENVLIEREKEFAQFHSITDLQAIYTVKLIDRLELENNCALLLAHIITEGTISFIMNMLSTLKEKQQ